MGDFYELFFEDAVAAAKALGIVLTKRGKHEGADIPTCGIPFECAHEALYRLISLGHRVAVCERVDDPEQARKRGPGSMVRPRLSTYRHRNSEGGRRRAASAPCCIHVAWTSRHFLKSV